MPITHILIASNTVSTTNTTLVQFSSIPNTYDDLLIKYASSMNIGSSSLDINIRFNGVTSGAYSDTLIGINNTPPTAPQSVTSTNNIWHRLYLTSSGEDGTPFTFGNGEAYLSNYTSSFNKSMHSFGIVSRSNNIPRMSIGAHVFNNTSPITSISLQSGTFNFSLGSSFFLYGIKNT